MGSADMVVIVVRRLFDWVDTATCVGFVGFVVDDVNVNVDAGVVVKAVATEVINSRYKKDD